MLVGVFRYVIMGQKIKVFLRHAAQSPSNVVTFNCCPLSCLLINLQ